MVRKHFFGAKRNYTTVSGPTDLHTSLIRLIASNRICRESHDHGEKCCELNKIMRLRISRRHCYAGYGATFSHDRLHWAMLALLANVYAVRSWLQKLLSALR